MRTNTRNSAFPRALPVGGGTVDTNDWYITNETGPNAPENELT